MVKRGVSSSSEISICSIKYSHGKRSNGSFNRSKSISRFTIILVVSLLLTLLFTFIVNALTGSEKGFCLNSGSEFICQKDVTAKDCLGNNPAFPKESPKRDDGTPFFIQGSNGLEYSGSLCKKGNYCCYDSATLKSILPTIEFPAQCSSGIYTEGTCDINAKAPNFTITGTIKDTSGKNLSDVDIKIQKTAAKTDAAGKYSITATVGTIELNVTKSGYIPQKRSIFLQSNRVEDFNLTKSSDKISVNFKITDDNNITLFSEIKLELQYLDGENKFSEITNKGEQSFSNVPSGRYLLIITPSDPKYLKDQKEIELLESKTITIRIRTTIFSQQTIQVTTDGKTPVLAAKIFINGKFEGLSNALGQFPTFLQTTSDGKEYVFKAEKQDFTNQSITQRILPASGIVNLQIAPIFSDCLTYPTTKVLNGNVIQGKKDIKIDWKSNGCSGVIGYEIYKNAQFIKSVSDTVTDYIDQDTDWGNTYSYEVAVIYSNFRVSQRALVTVDTGDISCRDSTIGENLCSIERKRIIVCNEKNQVVSLKPCVATEYCSGLSPNVECKTATPCTTLAGILGLTTTQDVCESKAFCYYDVSPSVVNFCFQCISAINPVNLGCYAYKSKDTCLRNNCQFTGQGASAGAGSGCQWNLLTPELNIGLCAPQEKPKDFSKCDLAEDLLVFTQINSPVCALFGRCVQDQTATSCIACEETTPCDLYFSQEACDGGNPPSLAQTDTKTFNGGQIINAKNLCQSLYCRWNGAANKCIKDGNFDTAEDEVSNTNTPIIVPIPQFEKGLNAGPSSVLTFTVSNRAESGIVLYCIASSTTDCLPGKSFVAGSSDSSLSFQYSNSRFQINLSQAVEKQFGFLDQGKFILKLTAISNQTKNRAKLQSYQFNGNFKPINITFETKDFDDKIIIYTFLDREAHCTDKLTSSVLSQSFTSDTVSIVPQSDTFAAIFGRDKIQENGLYIYTIECRDNFGNKAAKNISVIHNSFISITNPKSRVTIKEGITQFNMQSNPEAKCTVVDTTDNKNNEVYNSKTEKIKHDFTVNLDKVQTFFYNITCIAPEKTDSLIYDLTLDNIPPETVLSVVNVLQKYSRVFKDDNFEAFIPTDSSINFVCTNTPTKGFPCSATFYCIVNQTDDTCEPKLSTKVVPLSTTKETKSIKLCFQSVELTDDKTKNLTETKKCGIIRIGDPIGISVTSPNPYRTEPNGDLKNAGTDKIAFTLNISTKLLTEQCAFVDNVKDAQQSYDNYPYKFTKVDNSNHYAKFPDKVPLFKEGQKQTKDIFVKCKTTEGFINEQIPVKLSITYDNTKPIINGSFNPSLVVSPPKEITLTVLSDDQIICRLGKGINGSNFDQLEKQTKESIGNFYQNINTYTERFETEPAKNTFTYTLLCKNTAGLLSDPLTVEYKIDFNRGWQLINVKPTGGYSGKETELLAETSRDAVCTVSSPASGILTRKQNTFAAFVYNTIFRPTIEQKYNIPLSCDIQGTIDQGNFSFTADLTSPLIHNYDIGFKNEFGGYETCSLNAVPFRINVTENSYVTKIDYSVGNITSGTFKGFAEVATGTTTTSQSTSTTTSTTNQTNQSQAAQSLSQSTSSTPTHTDLISNIILLEDTLLEQNKKYNLVITVFDAANNSITKSEVFTAKQKNLSKIESCLDKDPPTVTHQLYGDEINGYQLKLNCQDSSGYCQLIFNTVKKGSTCNPSIKYSSQYSVPGYSGTEGIRDVCYEACDALNNCKTGTIPKIDVTMKDSDFDGIPDRDDKCPKTPTTEPANTQGCSENQIQFPDTDGEGLYDWWEDQYNSSTCLLDKTKKDTDKNGVEDDEEDCDLDGASNIAEQKAKTDPLDKNSFPDADKDGIGDAFDACTTDPDEIEYVDVDGCVLDSDRDGIPDYWEDKYGLDKFDPNDANEDPDKDGATNLEEYLRRSNPKKAEGKIVKKTSLAAIIILVLGILLFVSGLSYILILKYKPELIKNLPWRKNLAKIIQHIPTIGDLEAKYREQQRIFQERARRRKEAEERAELIERRIEAKEKQREKIFEVFGGGKEYEKLKEKKEQESKGFKKTGEKGAGEKESVGAKIEKLPEFKSLSEKIAKVAKQPEKAEHILKGLGSKEFTALRNMVKETSSHAKDKTGKASEEFQKLKSLIGKSEKHLPKFYQKVGEMSEKETKDIFSKISEIAKKKKK